jgi:hypothetical protein
MKLNKELLLKLIKESMHQSIGPDDPTEAGPKIQTMDKEAFLEKEWRNWADEFNVENWQEGAMINKVLEAAYDRIAKELELDDLGMYE